MTTTISAGQKSAASRASRTRNAKAIEEGDQRPIDLALLKQLLRRALMAADATIADNPSVIACTHQDIGGEHYHANFCRCGALVVPVGTALESLAPTFGVAFALQQALRGDAIRMLQRKRRKVESNEPIATAACDAACDAA